jgi:two-component system cell cycle sensor histidine kinase/response regulator CckA
VNAPPSAGSGEARQRRRWETLGQIAGGVAHDFNNILLVITASAEQLTEPEWPLPCRREAELILQATRRGTALTRQVLDFARAPAATCGPVDLNVVVREGLSLLGRVLGPRVALATELSPAPLPVSIDPVHLEQILANLLTNARDAMPGGGTVTVRTFRLPAGYREESGRYALQEPAVLLRVEDTGIGMDERTLSRVFEAFFTTKPYGHGTGLGLTIVQALVRESGGSVRVSSARGAGTAFDLVLPAAR